MEKDRKKYLGGSDINRLVHGNEDEWHQLWAEKTGRADPEDLTDNLPVQIGITTEPLNIWWFSRNYELKVKEQQWKEMNYEGVPAGGTLDGVIESEPSFVECKHTYDSNKMVDVAERYMPQIQWYCFLSNLDGCYLSVLFGNRRWEATYIKKNWDYINEIKLLAKKFWQAVVKDESPVVDDKPILSIDDIELNDMVARDASQDNHFNTLADEYIEFEQPARQFERAKKELKEIVKPNERKVYTDKLIINRDKRGALRFTIPTPKENTQ